MYEVERVLGPSVTQFVEEHVRSLLAWDILVFFHRHPGLVIDSEEIAARLGRRTEEVIPEVAEFCKARILACVEGGVCFKPAPEMEDRVNEFVDSCQSRGRRLALIALVLQRMSRPADD